MFIDRSQYGVIGWPIQFPASSKSCGCKKYPYPSSAEVVGSSNPLPLASRVILALTDAASRIDNPLHPRRRNEIINDARTFHREKDLQDIVDEDTFVRGVLAAWRPDREDVEDIPDLTPIEAAALLHEVTGTTWQQIKRLPRDFHIVLVTCCFAAVAQSVLPVVWQPLGSYIYINLY